jgi:hypothetical protein
MVEVAEKNAIVFIRAAERMIVRDPFVRMMCLAE